MLPTWRATKPGTVDIADAPFDGSGALQASLALADQMRCDTADTAGAMQDDLHEIPMAHRYVMS